MDKKKPMAEDKKPAKTKTIIDVAHPGESAPAANSKSVIVSNRPMLQDPMVVKDTKLLSDKPAEDPLLKASGGPDLKPSAPTLPAADKPVENDETSVPVTTIKPVEADSANKEPSPSDDSNNTGDETKAEVEDKAEKPEPDTDNKPEPDKPKPAEPEAGDKPATTGEETEASSPSKEETTKQLQEEATEQAKHQEVIDKLADSKQYYLPINTVEKRRSRRFVALGIVLSLLLVVAWVDVALDASLIQLGGIKPLTHFFSN